MGSQRVKHDLATEQEEQQSSGEKIEVGFGIKDESLKTVPFVATHLNEPPTRTI